MPQDFITINPLAMKELSARGGRALAAAITEKTGMYARLYAPGSMKTKIRVIFSATGGGLGIVVSDHPATTFVIYKTKPHDIKARRKGGYLKFQMNGVDTFVGPSPTRVVHHPGNQHPNNFLLRALESARMI